MILTIILTLFVVSQLIISALEYDGSPLQASDNLWNRAVYWLYRYINDDDEGGHPLRLKKVPVTAENKVKHQH